jgi:hypothetical protein
VPSSRLIFLSFCGTVPFFVAVNLFFDTVIQTIILLPSGDRSAPTREISSFLASRTLRRAFTTRPTQAWRHLMVSIPFLHRDMQKSSLSRRAPWPKLASSMASRRKPSPLRNRGVLQPLMLQNLLPRNPRCKRRGNVNGPVFREMRKPIASRTSIIIPCLWILPCSIANAMGNAITVGR